MSIVLGIAMALVILVSTGMVMMIVIHGTGMGVMIIGAIKIANSGIGGVLGLIIAANTGLVMVGVGGIMAANMLIAIPVNVAM